VTAFAHIGGVPVEETLGSFGPALLIALGLTAAKLRAWSVRIRTRVASHARLVPKSSAATRFNRTNAAQERLSRPTSRPSRHS
jgi:hypothetical protein